MPDLSIPLLAQTGMLAWVALRQRHVPACLALTVITWRRKDHNRIYNDLPRNRR